MIDEAKLAKIRAAIDPITGNWFSEGEGHMHYFAHWCQQVRSDAARGIYTCLQCGGTQCEAGTEDNCDKIWCLQCVDYTGDLPR